MQWRITKNQSYLYTTSDLPLIQYPFCLRCRLDALECSSLYNLLAWTSSEAPLYTLFDELREFLAKRCISRTKYYIINIYLQNKNVVLKGPSEECCVTPIFDYLVIWFIWDIAIYFYIYYVMLSEDLIWFYATWWLILLLNKIRFENKIKYLVVG